VKYYEFGEFRCLDSCHLCIPKAYSPYGNNTCKDTVERDIVLYDLDNPETDDQYVIDLAKKETTNNILVGSKPYLSHHKNLKDYHVYNQNPCDPWDYLSVLQPGGCVGGPDSDYERLYNFDENDPWKIPRWGYLFYHDRYLWTNNIWKLPHYEYFTVEAWVRRDIDMYHDVKLTKVMGQVINKIDIDRTWFNYMFGIDMNIERVRFYFMG